MRPSRFGVVSLLLLLGLAAGSNLYISNARTIYLSPILPSDSKTRLVLFDGRDTIEGSGWWPSVPEGIEGLGDPFIWQRVEQVNRRYYLMFFSDPADPFQGAVHHLYAITSGWPFFTVEVKQVTHVPTNAVIWPSDQSSAVTYHPLGLILNPIIYALPIWLLVIRIRWAYITRRCRKRERLGLCVGCAYELEGMSVCPECGRATGGQAARR